MATLDLQVVTVEDSAAFVVGNVNFSAALVKDWIDFNAGKSAETCRTYTKALKNFFCWMRANNVAVPCRNDVIAYSNDLCATKSVRTARLYTTAVKIFSKWLASLSKGFTNFADGVELPKLVEEDETHTREALTLSEAKQVLKSFTGTDEKSLRDKCIMRLMFNCGLRSIEIVRLDCDDIEKRHGKIFLKVWGKGRKGKGARVEIPKTVHSMILDYLNARNSKRKKGEPMFVSTSNRNRGQRIQTQTVSRLAKKSFRAVGIDSPYIVCHSCRHTFATLLLENGVDIDKVKATLRHRSITTTEVYRHDLTAAKNNSVGVMCALLDD